MLPIFHIENFTFSGKVSTKCHLFMVKSVDSYQTVKLEITSLFVMIIQFVMCYDYRRP